MSRSFFLVAAIIMMFGLYRCANIKPGESKFHAPISTAINQMYAEQNPLCRVIPLVDGFPHVAALSYQDGQPTGRPYNPLGLSWSRLVESGLLRETPKYDLDLRQVGFEYDLTSKGREYYMPLSRESGKELARFCLGRVVLKEITALAKPFYSIQGLNVVATYTMKGEEVSSDVYGDIGLALDIQAPKRSETGEILFPGQQSTFVFNNDSGELMPGLTY